MLALGIIHCVGCGLTDAECPSFTVIGLFHSSHANMQSSKKNSKDLKTFKYSFCSTSLRFLKRH